MTTIHGVTHATPKVRLPPGSTDCHTHVFGPAERFPYALTRAYTPPDASIADLDALHHHLGIERVVIVHPSPYANDNRVSVDALQRLGPNRARGVAVVDPTTPMPELRALDTAGMRGARLNLETAGVHDPVRAWMLVETTTRRLAEIGWHLQVFARLPVLAALADRLAGVPVPLVIDHFGLPDAALGVRQPGFDAVRRLVGSGKAYVKLSAGYRVSRRPDQAEVAPLARALIADNPERIVWGTDWPHPGGAHSKAADLEPFQPIDDGAALNRLATWAGDAATLQTILVTNPARLYGFAP